MRPVALQETSTYAPPFSHLVWAAFWLVSAGVPAFVLLAAAARNTAIRCLSTMQAGRGAMVFLENYGGQGRVVRLPVRRQDRQEVVARVGAAAATAGASVDVGFDVALLYNYIHGLTPDGRHGYEDAKPAWTAARIAEISPRAGPPALTVGTRHVSRQER